MDDDDESDAVPREPIDERLDEGWECLKKNDFEGARISARAAQKIDPRSAEALTLLGAVSAAEGDEESALEQYRGAMRLDPDYVAPALYAAELLAWEREEYEAALLLVERVLDGADDEEDFLDAILLKAEILTAHGDLADARATLDELPPTQLPSAAFHNRAARAYCDLEHFDEAEGHFQQAIVLDPKSGDAYHGLGMVYEEKDDSRAMVKAWLRVRELDLDDPPPPSALSQDEFEKIAEDALAELPERIGELLENVPIVAADYPSIEIVAEGNDPRMLGFFSGVPYPDKSHLGGSPHLDCVFLYKQNIERMARNREETAREIRVTLLHETGHFFGLSEEELEAMGLG